MEYDALTRQQFELLARMTSAMSAFADHVLPDVVQFGSRAELNELQELSTISTLGLIVWNSFSRGSSEAGYSFSV
jgi:hypothetical protein